MKTSSVNTSRVKGLSLTRKPGESVTIGKSEIIVHVVRVKGKHVQLVFQDNTPEGVSIFRTEIYEPKDFNGGLPL